jgi:hypothetical protein
VAHVARLPVAELVDPANRLRVRHPSGWVGPAFQVRGMVVWGFTAGVLSALLDMAGWARPWAQDRVAELPPSNAQPAPSAGIDPAPSGSATAALRETGPLAGDDDSDRRRHTAAEPA